MLAFVKKLHRHSDELLHLALLLSLIRVDPESYLGLGLGRSNNIHDSFRNITMGDTWAHIPFQRSALDVPYLHPKSVEASLAQYQEELIEDLNDLGRYTSILPHLEHPRMVGYLLDESGGSLNHDLPSPAVASTSSSSSISDIVQAPSSESRAPMEPSNAADLSEEVNSISRTGCTTVYVHN